MKRILLLILATALVGCSSELAQEQIQEVQTHEFIEPVQSENTKESDKQGNIHKEDTIEESGIREVEITDDEKIIIDEALEMTTIGTAYENATYAYKITVENNKPALELTVIKSMNDLMQSYQTDVDGLIQSIKKSLTFNSAAQIMRDSGIAIDYMIITFEDTPGDMFTMKSFKIE